MTTLHRLVLLLALAAGIIGTPVDAGTMSQNFNSVSTGNEWPTAPTGNTPGNHSSTNGWELRGGVIFSTYTYDGYSGWFGPYTAPAAQTLTTPLLAQGAGQISYVTRLASSGSGIFRLQKSATGADPWTTLATVTNSSTSWGSVTHNFDDIYNSTYLRFVRDSGTPYIGFDEIVITPPPAIVTFSDTGTDPATVYVDSPADIVSTITPFGDVSSMTVTSFWQVGSTVGPWNTMAMTNSGGNVWRSAGSIPGQSFGYRVYFYVEARFSGSEAQSPAKDPAAGATAPYYYDTAQRAFETGFNSMNVIDELPAAMGLIADYTWEGVAESASPITNAQFRFRGVDTNTVQHTWGDNTPPAGVMPLRDTATEGQSAVGIPGTNSGQFVFYFTETNLAYEVRQGAYHDFSGWTIDPYGSDTDGGWLATNANIKVDPARQYEGQACYLDSNGTAYVRSPYLDHGIGHISFWYRNWTTNESVTATELYVQKSKTGGGNTAEWVTVQTLPSIVAKEYGRFHVAINDRNYRFVRILNSTNAASRARLCIDNFLISQAGAGVTFTNAVTTPLDPIVISPVDVSVDILPWANASNRTATIYYRHGQTGAFTDMGMTSSGNTFTTTNPIPPVTGAATNVQYYFMCAFEGYESEWASPIYYPDGGSNAPSSYSVRPGVAFSNLVRTPVNPTINNTVTIRINIATEPGITDLSTRLWYRAGASGYFDATALSFISGTTYEGVIPRGQAGVMQFYVDATYSGASITNILSSYYPAGGPNAPLSYTNSSTTRTQNFNSVNTGNEWPTAPTSTTPGNHFSTNGWELIKGIIVSTGIPPYGGSGYSGWLGPLAAAPDTYLLTPLMVGGIGSVSFVRRCSSASRTDYVVELIGSDESTTTLIAQASYNSETWAPIPYFVDALESSYIRIRKINDRAGNLYFGMDEISISYPSARITISDVSYAPAYPSRDLPTTISCTIASATVYFPAMSISARIRHRIKDSGNPWSSPIEMTRSGAHTYTAQVPAVYEGGDEVEYYIESTFGGQYDSAPANHSPTYFPAGPVVQTTQYYGVPTSGFPSFSYRYFNSPYDHLEIQGNVESSAMAQIDDDVWEGVFSTGPTNMLVLNLYGYNRLDNSLSTPINSAWGDTNQWRITPPVVGTIDEGASSMVLQGSLSGFYAVRVDLNTGEYMIIRADYQDFDHWFLNDGLFDDGAQGSAQTSWSQNFDTWTNNTDKGYSVDYEGLWTNYTSWTATPTFVGGWGASGFRSVDAGGGRHRIELQAAQSVGQVRQGNAMLVDNDGVGEVALTYRAADTNTYPTVYTGPESFSEIRVIASVNCSETHDDMGAYFGVRYRYMNSSNYYEARLVQDGNNTLRADIYKTVAGTTSLGTAGTATSGTTLAGMAPQTVTVSVSTANKHNVYLGSTRLITDWTDSTIPGPGTFGFNVRDASARVNNVTVTTNSIVALEEYFTNSTATGWTTGGNGWTINETDDTYERVGHFGGPIQLRVGTADTLPDQWESIVPVVDLSATSLAYVTTNISFHMAPEAYMVMMHGTGVGNLRLDNVSVTGWRAFTNSYGTTAANSWIGGDSRATTEQRDSSPHSLELRASRALSIPAKSQFVRSPEVTTIGTISLRYFIPTDSPNVTLVSEYSDDLNRTLFHSFSTNVLTDKGVWKTWSLPVNLDQSPRKLHLRLVNATTNGDGRIYIDNIQIPDYQEANTNAWIAYNALLTDDNTDLTDNNENLTYVSGARRSGFLNYSTTEDIAGSVPFTNASPYVRSPNIPLGIGEISFWLRRWPISATVSNSATVVVEISPTALPGSWQSMFTTTVLNTTWEHVVLPYYNSSNHFVRISNTINMATPKQDRVGIDRLMIKAPLATDLIVTNVTIVPEVPLDTDTVKVRAQLTDYILSPTVTQIRAYYHVGTNQWGTWPEDQYLTLQLDESASDPDAMPPIYAYESIGSIPAQSIDATVQYRVKVAFDGTLHADMTSPKIHAAPGPNPAWYEPVNYNTSLGSPDAQNPYYVVFSCLPGTVWINEFNVDQNDEPYGAREYIELCGPDGTSIQNWKIALTTVGDLNGNGITTSQLYRITQNTALTDQTNGVGFWVLGDVHPQIPADQTFTNLPDGDGFNMLAEGGIQLLRSMGAVEDAVSYNVISIVDDTYATAMTNVGFIYAGANDYYNQSPLALVGSGTGRVDFVWSDDTGNGSYTPGMANLLQTFLINGPPETFQLLIESLEMGSNIVLWTTSSNGFAPYVMYSTNLLQSNGWYNVTNESWAVSNNSFRIWFPVMTNSPVYFYRITATN